MPLGVSLFPPLSGPYLIPVLGLPQDLDAPEQADFRHVSLLRQIERQPFRCVDDRRLRRPRYRVKLRPCVRQALRQRDYKNECFGLRFGLDVGLGFGLAFGLAFGLGLGLGLGVGLDFGLGFGLGFLGLG